eukprot:5035029-Prymnesium_polylepis.1
MEAPETFSPVFLLRVSQDEHENRYRELKESKVRELQLVCIGNVGFPVSPSPGGIVKKPNRYKCSKSCCRADGNAAGAHRYQHKYHAAYE